jgi:hypothetical protein
MLSPMAQDAAPMPVSSSRIPTVRAATLGLEQHGTVRPPARETMLGPLPGLSSLLQGLGTAPALPCPPGLTYHVCTCQALGRFLGLSSSE